MSKDWRKEIEKVAGEDEVIRIQADQLRSFSQKIFEEIGVNKDDAFIIADHLVDADLRGVYSHGVMRIPIYIHQMKKNGPGSINRNPQVKVIKESGATALIDGDNALGMVSSYRAMELAIKKTKENGTSAVGVRGSNHNGAEAYYTMMAMQEDMIGFCVTIGGKNIIAPTGGLTALLGNNPFSFAIPAGEHYPVVLDMACSVVARGWIMLARQHGWEIPEGWAVDKDGNPTTDPTAAYDGLVLPVGGYKGYALALIGAVLGGILTGASIGSEVTDLVEDFDVNQNLGHYFGAIAIDRFLPVNEFKARMDRLIGELKGARKMSGIDEIYLPGEKEFNMKKENSEKGIPLSRTIIEELNELCSEDLEI